MSRTKEEWARIHETAEHMNETDRMERQRPRDRIAQLEAQLAEREAQCAAMREALEPVVASQDRWWTKHPENPEKDEPELFVKCRAALATDAGKAMLERLKVAENPRVTIEGAFQQTDTALKVAEMATRRAEKAKAAVTELRSAMDSADCEYRDGAKGCRVDSPCWRCRAEKAERDAAAARACTECGSASHWRPNEDEALCGDCSRAQAIEECAKVAQTQYMDSGIFPAQECGSTIASAIRALKDGGKT